MRFGSVHIVRHVNKIEMFKIRAYSRGTKRLLHTKPCVRGGAADSARVGGVMIDTLNWRRAPSDQRGRSPSWSRFNMQLI